MTKLAISKIQKKLKSANEELFEGDSLSESSSDEHHFIPDLETFFEEAKDKFPLEEMLKQTRFKKLNSSSSNKSSKDSQSLTSSESSSNDTFFENDSDWEYDDIRSVGTEKIYNELEDVNNNLINRINYARNAAKADFNEDIKSSHRISTPFQ